MKHKLSLITIAVACALASAAVSANTDGYDFNYDATGATRPSAVFNDGAHVFFQTGGARPRVVCEDDGSSLHTAMVGPYLQVDRLCGQYRLAGDGMQSVVTYVGAHSAAQATSTSQENAPAAAEPTFVPLRRVSNYGTHGSLPMRFYRLHENTLLEALTAIIPGDMNAEIDSNVDLLGTHVTVTGRRQWTGALENAMVQSGLYARIDWTSRKIFIAQGYKTVATADKHTHLHKTAAIVSMPAATKPVAMKVVEPSQHVDANQRVAANQTKNAMDGTKTGGAPAVATAQHASVKPFIPSGQVAVTEPYVVGQAAHANTAPIETPANATPASTPASTPHAASAAPLEPIRLVRGELLSDVVRLYAARNGYTVLWNADFDERIQENAVIPAPASFTAGLAELLQPANGLQPGMSGKLVIITDKE